MLQPVFLEIKGFFLDVSCYLYVQKSYWKKSITDEGQLFE